jgi:energy-coupling factor transport system permease protein
VIGAPLDIAAAAGGGRAWLARFNPAAKLAAALLVTIGLVVAIDPVTSGVVLLVELALIPASGLSRRTLLRLGLPLLVAAVSTGYVNAVFGTAGLVDAIGVAVRLPAIALPGVLAAATTDPTELADALVQRLRLPERPAIGALAALRMLPLLAAEWRTLELARRARGLDAGRNPVRALRLFVSMAFALLVRAIRTGTLLAAAMDARGFGTGPRTHARESPVARRDAILVGATAVVVAGAHAISLLAGTWRPLL